MGRDSRKRSTTGAQCTNKNVLLVGDSILDHRAWVLESSDTTSAKLKKCGINVVDASVEETKAIHLLEHDTRRVPSRYIEMHKGTEKQYQAEIVDLFPSENFEVIVISAGGNDFLLAEPSDLFAWMAASSSGELDLHVRNAVARTIYDRLCVVLGRYQDAYPSSSVVFLPPYKLNEAAAYAICVYGLDFLHPAPSARSVKMWINALIDKLLTMLVTNGFTLLPISWREGDFAVSDVNFPEPTAQGATRICDAIVEFLYHHKKQK